jgi:WD40 repeat protein
MAGPRFAMQLGHSASGVVSVAVSSDARFALTGDSQGIACLWHLETGAEIRRFTGHGGNAQVAVALSTSGQLALTGSGEGVAYVWDAATGSEVSRVSHGAAITSLAFSPDERSFLTNGQDGVVRVWSLASTNELSSVAGHNAIYEPLRGEVLTVEGRSSVHVWDAKRGFFLRAPKHCHNLVWSVAYSPDGRLLVTSGTDDSKGTKASVCLRDANTQRELWRYEIDGTDWTASLGFSPDGKLVFVGGPGAPYGFRGVKVLDSASGSLLWHFADDADGNCNTAISSNGKVLVTKHTKHPSIAVWDINRRIELKKLEGQASVVSAIDVSPDGYLILVGTRGLGAVLWDIHTSQSRVMWKGSANVSSAAFSPKGELAVVGTDWEAFLLDTKTGGVVAKLAGHSPFDGVESVAFSPSGELVATGSSNSVRVWDTCGQQLFSLQEHGIGKGLAFSPQGEQILTAGNSALVWDLKTHRIVKRFGTQYVEAVAYSPDGSSLLTAGIDGPARLWDSGSGDLRGLYSQETALPFKAALSFSRDGKSFLMASGDSGVARLWRIGAQREQIHFDHEEAITDVAFSRDGAFVLTGGQDGSVRIWETSKGRELARLVSIRDGTWAVVTPDQRFDTNNLEEIRGFSWLMPDDPLAPLRPEIFMRDYYEPRLLARSLAGETFNPLPSLADLNRVQPEVEIVDIQPENGSPDEVVVTVVVRGVERDFGADLRKKTWKSGVYDLRLFRDGQLVGQYPRIEAPRAEGNASEAGLLQWSQDHKILQGTGSQRVPFRHVRLPRREGLKEVEFSAYAFNADRVKSATALKSYTLPDLPVRKGRAYVIGVGVSAYEDPSWDLKYADADARRLLEVLPPQLEATEQYDDVVPIPLFADREGGAGPSVANATKTNIEGVLDLLAGRPVATEVRHAIPNADRVQQARPEDLVLISYSSHGYADLGGNFYLFPYDIGPSTSGKVSDELLRRAISSAELSLWLRDVDAGELVMVVDACHSAASVDSPKFKPGPMGSRGLGQLAYDKGMRILASTRANDVAWESPKIQQGLLTYVLVREGLEEGHADFEPEDEVIGVREWLQYGVKRVPELYRAMCEGKVNDAQLVAFDGRRDVPVPEAGDENMVNLQQPCLFDFRGANDDIRLVVRTRVRTRSD